MTIMKLPFLALGATLMATVASAQTDAYRFSGSHAGGPADALIPDGKPPMR